jgi:hypothetical protein
MRNDRVQSVTASQSPATGVGDSPAPHAPAPGTAAIERETPSPSPEEIADRVYELLCQDLRWARERSGRW